MIEQCERAQRVCDAVSAALQTLRHTRAQTADLLAEMRRIPSLDPCLDTAFIGAEAPAHVPIVPVEPNIALTEHQVAMEVLRMLCTLLAGFPAHMQVTIIKALTARTMLVVAAQLQTPSIVHSA